MQKYRRADGKCIVYRTSRERRSTILIVMPMMPTLFLASVNNTRSTFSTNEEYFEADPLAVSPGSFCQRHYWQDGFSSRVSLPESQL